MKDSYEAAQDRQHAINKAARNLTTEEAVRFLECGVKMEQTIVKMEAALRKVYKTDRPQRKLKSL